MYTALERRLNETVEKNGKIIIGYTNNGFHMLDTLDLDSYELRENYISIVSGGFVMTARGEVSYDSEMDEFLFIGEGGECAIGFVE